MKEQMREAFEAWAESRCYYLDRDAEDKYIKCTTALAWEIWREAQPKVNRNKDRLDNQFADEAIRVLQAAGYETLGCGIADEFFSLKDKISELEAALSAVPNHVEDALKMVQSQAQQPAQDAKEKDIAEAVTLLSAVFDAWENGTDCYDDFDGVSGSFIGKAFNLDYEIFKRCCSLLNRINPPRNVSQQPAQEPVMDITFSQFLSDVHTAAGLVSHGKQCKALGERLGKYVMKYREPVSSNEHVKQESKGHCKLGDACNCWGDLPRIREGCSSWVMPPVKEVE